jgi:hypothetical protein
VSAPLPEPEVEDFDDEPRFNRKEAAIYLLNKYKIGSERTLEKAAVTGDGPPYFKSRGVVIYGQSALDTWAREQLGTAHRSTSEHLASPTSRMAPHEHLTSQAPRTMPATDTTKAVKPAKAPVAARRAGMAKSR